MAIESNAPTDSGDDHVKIPNPAILNILDPLHRSLLNNNLQYEQVNRNIGGGGDAQLSIVQSDTDEYFTATSAIVSIDSATECDVIINADQLLLDADQQQNDDDGPIKVNRPLNNHMRCIEQRKQTDFTHDTFDSGNQRTENGKHQLKQYEQSKQILKQKQPHVRLNVLDTENRCDTIHQANDGTQQQQQRRLTNAKAWSRSHEQITHKFSRQSTRNSIDTKLPFGGAACADYHQQHHNNIKRAACKRFVSNNYSDSSDVNSEQNLVIENMRNRECEMFRKISFNNGYFDATDSSSSGSYMYCSRSNASAVESTSVHGRRSANGKATICACNKSSPKFPTKRKCRSFPLTEQRQLEATTNCRRENLTHNQMKSKQNDCVRSTNNNHAICPSHDADNTGTQTKTYQTNSRKITITIKTKTVPVQITNSNQQQQQAIENYLTSACETSEESDTTVSDYVTLYKESDSKAAAAQIVECSGGTNNGANDDVPSHISSDSECCGSDDDNSFFSIKSDIECQSESSQYFNCASFTEQSVETNCLTKDDDDENGNGTQIPESKQSDIKQMRTKTVNREKTQSQSKHIAMKKARTPMICIEQEMCENRIVTSKIEVDKTKIKEFKQRLKKRTQPKLIIDNSFSEEIFNEALNRSIDIGCDKNVIDDIVTSLEAEKCAQMQKQQQLNTNLPTKYEKNAQNTKQKLFNDGFGFDKSSPKYTAKSINRLLAHRIEQQSITSVRRTLLHNVAYAITEKERQQKLEKKTRCDLAPIKPPRSFTTSSSSSPLSKQSFESSATVPIAELNGQRPPEMGFVIPSKYHGEQMRVGEEHSIQFGWVQRPSSNIENDETPSGYATADQFTQINSMSYHTPAAAAVKSPPHIGFRVPKENIDTVDSSAKDFEHFSATLSKTPPNNLSTPIKDAIDATTNTQFMSAEERPSQVASPMAVKPIETLCKNCHCQVKKENKQQYATLGRTGKRIGKAAIKRTKTLIGTSKKFLQKPMIKAASPAKLANKAKRNDEDIFSTPLKDGDQTVSNNRDTISSADYKKCVDKTLNLTPKPDEPINQNAVELNPSPKRAAEISHIRLVKDATQAMDSEKNDSEEYATPDEAFDFERIVNVPATNKTKPVKRSPSKMIMKLAKSSKKLFNKKPKDRKCESVADDAPHYYKPNDYDEFDNKVLLMGEMLSEMRKRIENGPDTSTNIDEDAATEASGDRPSSAKKCLFRDRVYSTSSGDLLEQDSLVEKIATIDLHDEPEPLYAEIEPTKSVKQHDTLYHSCGANEHDGEDDDDVNAIKVYKSSEPVDLKEVYISDRSNTQPSKYIMVNNNPKILYATINRNSMQTRSLETIESKTEHSDDQADDALAERQSFHLTSSFESLDMSLINDFATAIQTELDECQYKMSEMFTTATSEPNQTGTDEVDVGAQKGDRKSTSGSESTAISDINSGCSSFYRRNKNIVLNRSRKMLSDFVDTLSVDTVGTGSYCESLSRGNDLNSEIKDTITSLEYMPSEAGDSTDLSHDFTTNIAAFRSCIDETNTSKNSTKFLSLNRPDSDSMSSTSPGSSLYRTLAKNDSPSRKLKKMSPSLKAIKTKFRNSFRMDAKKPSREKNESFVSAALGFDETTELRSCSSSSISSGSSADLKRKKLFESICCQLETIPADSLANASEMTHLIDRIRQQQAMRKSIQSALDVCRTNGEFHNSRELVEAEQLMLMSCLKECSALEKLIALWQSDNAMTTTAAATEGIDELGEGILTIKYLEFELKVDTMFDTHYNFFYVCVCSFNDQVEFTDAKERNGNRIVFNNLKIKFTKLMADFEIRVEIYALRLRKNPPTEMGSDTYLSQCNSSRFRLQGKTLLTSTNLSRKHISSSYHSPRKLQRTSDDKYVYTSYGLLSPEIVLFGQVNTLCDILKIGYQEQLYFNDSMANGFLNLADSKQKWDRLWCRIDGFSMHFWKYPQDANDSQPPILSLHLDQCNYRTKSLLVDREICPRPRTFKIDVVHAPSADQLDRHRCIQSYFISAENQLDLELWLSEIQKIFEIIKCWNI